MDKKFNVDVNNVNFHELEDVISINRDVDIGKHLPQDIIGKGAEFTNIRVRENIELSNLWAKLNSLMENLYIGSADKLGLSAYKKLIEDENIKGNLEEQRKKIYALWNMARIWTHRTFEEWLDLYLGKENYVLSFDYDKYGIEILVNVKESLNLELDDFQKKVRKIIPANLTQFIRIKFIRDQTIYYGMYGQKAKHYKVLPNKVEDKVFENKIFMGMETYHKKIKRVAIMSKS
nr:MAG TPA: tail protein [Caudoviricetes sp.]